MLSFVNSDDIVIPLAGFSTKSMIQLCWLREYRTYTKNTIVRNIVIGRFIYLLQIKVFDILLDAYFVVWIEVKLLPLFRWQSYVYLTTPPPLPLAKIHHKAEYLLCIIFIYIYASVSLKRIEPYRTSVTIRERLECNNIPPSPLPLRESCFRRPWLNFMNERVQFKLKKKNSKPINFYQSNPLKKAGIENTSLFIGCGRRETGRIREKYVTKFLSFSKCTWKPRTCFIPYYSGLPIWLRSPVDHSWHFLFFVLLDDIPVGKVLCGALPYLYNKRPENNPPSPSL